MYLFECNHACSVCVLCFKSKGLNAVSFLPLIALARSLARLGRCAEALACNLRALRLISAMLGDGTFTALMIEFNVCRLLVVLGRVDDARRRASLALASYRMRACVGGADALSAQCAARLREMQADLARLGEQLLDCI